MNEKLRLAHLSSRALQRALPEAAATGGAVLGLVLAGALLHQTAAGLTACLGTLAVAGAGITDGPPRARLAAMLTALVPAVAAATIAPSLASLGHGGDLALLALVAFAAAFGGYSRPLAVAMVRFVLFLLMTYHAPATPDAAFTLPLLVIAGGAWAMLLQLPFRTTATPVAAPSPTAPQPTAAQRGARFRRVMGELAGWQYPIRLTGALAIALLLPRLWPAHHLHWAALTVAILCERQPEGVAGRALKRAAGTVIGVAVAGLAFAAPLPGWAMALAMGLLATLRPLAKARHALVYAATMTPMVLLIVEGGAPAPPALLLDRVAACVAGAAIVLACDTLLARLLLRRAPAGPAGAATGTARSPGSARSTARRS